MRIFTFLVRMVKPHTDKEEVDAALAGRKLKKRIVAINFDIKACRFWTALQRLGYQLCYDAGAGWDTAPEKRVRSIRLVKVWDVPKGAKLVYAVDGKLVAITVEEGSKKLVMK